MIPAHAQRSDETRLGSEGLASRQDNERGVVLEQAACKRRHGIDDAGGERRSAACALGDDLADEPLFAKLLVVRVARFGDAVGIEHETIARGELDDAAA